MSVTSQNIGKYRITEFKEKTAVKSGEPFRLGLLLISLVAALGAFALLLFFKPVTVGLLFLLGLVLLGAGIFAGMAISPIRS